MQKERLDVKRSARPAAVDRAVAPTVEHRRGDRDRRLLAGAAGRLHRAPWRVLAGRIVVNAIAVALVEVLLPGVRANPVHPVLGYLAVGVLLGLINAFIKPAIQFVALPLLLGSLGLVVILVDIVVFWLLDQLTPFLHTDSPLWVVPAGVLLGLLSYVLDNLAGLTPPIVSDRREEERSR
jgi:putative membrane protein